MFVSKKKTKKNPNIYVQLVESYRNEDGKVRQRVIMHIGTAVTEEELEKIINLANQLKEMFQNKKAKEEIKACHAKELSKIQGTRNFILNCEPVKIINQGIKDIYGKIYDDIGLCTLIKSKSNYEAALKDIVLGKLICLGSKRKIADELKNKLDKKYSLNTIYRTMDKLNDEIIEKMKNQISDYNKSLLKGKISVLFYDATTIYFEAFEDDELRKLGYSKDLKFNQPQIVFTMLVTSEGLPLAYDVFPGNTYEGNTLKHSLSSWKNLYPDEKITLVADSGMLNNVNLEYLEQEGFDYIVCARLKNMDKLTKEKICSTKDNDQKEYFSEIALNNRRLIISYKDNRARKDRFDRDKNIEKLTEKLKSNAYPGSLISNYGYKKYITIKDNSTVQLNVEKINEDQKWDGLHGVITNIKTLSPVEIYNHYRDLWQIENAFRINKNDLKIRPIFHWSPKRVKAHLAISYIAFCCYKIAKFKFDKYSKTNLSHAQIREILNNVQVAIYKDKTNNRQFSMPLPVPNLAPSIYKSHGLKFELIPHSLHPG